MEHVIPLGEFIPFTISGNDSINRFYVIGMSNTGPAPLVVLDGSDNSLKFVDIDQGDFISVDGVASNRRTGLVFVSAGLPPTLRVVSPLKNEVSTISIPDYSFYGQHGFPMHRWIDINHETGIAYLLDHSASGGMGAIDIFDPATGEFSSIVLEDSIPRSIAVNSVTNTVYLAGELLGAGGALWVLNGNTLEVSRLAFGSEFVPAGPIGVNEVTDKLYLGGRSLNPPGVRGYAVIEGSNLSFRIVPGEDHNTLDIAVNPRTNEILSVGRTHNETFLRTLDEAAGTVRSVNLSYFYPGGVAVNRFTNRVYVVGFDAIGENQILVFSPKACSSTVTSLEGLMEEVQALSTSDGVIQRLTLLLRTVELALERSRPDVARLALALFQGRVVAFSNLPSTQPSAIPVNEANVAVCSASSVLVGVQPP